MNSLKQRNPPFIHFYDNKVTHRDNQQLFLIVICQVHRLDEKQENYVYIWDSCAIIKKKRFINFINIIMKYIGTKL